MKHRSLYDRMIPVIFACILVSMATGSLWDLSISYALLNQESLPALLAAGYGSMPNYLLGVICGYLLIRRAKPSGPPLQYYGRVVFGGLVLAGCAFYGGYDTCHYITAMPRGLAIGIGFGFAVLACVFAEWALQDASDAAVARLLKILILIALGPTILTHLVKIPWARPRMRLLVSGMGQMVSFHPWYQPGLADKAQLIASGIPKDDLKSFPSGHTTAAATALSLYYIASASPLLRSRRYQFFFGGLCWTLLIALSRIVIGAHFLTDVTAAFTITFTVFVLGGKLYRADQLLSE